MKTRVVILVILIFFFTFLGQISLNDSDKNNEKVPDLKGIMEILNDTCTGNPATEIHFTKNSQNYKNTEQSIKQEMGVVRFIIHPDGTLSGFTITKSAGPELDTEFILFIKIMDEMGKNDSYTERLVKGDNDVLRFSE